MDDSELIRRLAEKHRACDLTNFTPRDFVYAHGAPLEALAYLSLFWPEFEEFEGMVFLRETLEDASDRQRVLDALSKYKGDRHETELSFNVVEIPSDVFGRYASELPAGEEVYLAALLAEMWRCRLRLVYPDRPFVVEIWDKKRTGGDIAIAFYQAALSCKGPAAGQE